MDCKDSSKKAPEDFAAIILEKNIFKYFSSLGICFYGHEMLSESRLNV